MNGAYGILAGSEAGFGALVAVVVGFEGLIEVSAFGWGGAEGEVLLLGDVEVAVGATASAIDDGEGVSFGIIVESGDNC